MGQMGKSKAKAKKEIKKLIEKYERVRKNRQIKKYDEANTRKDFIMPLFKALGWDVYNTLKSFLPGSVLGVQIASGMRVV